MIKLLKTAAEGWKYIWGTMSKSQKLAFGAWVLFGMVIHGLFFSVMIKPWPLNVVFWFWVWLGWTSSSFLLMIFPTNLTILNCGILLVHCFVAGVVGETNATNQVLWYGLLFATCFVTSGITWFTRIKI